VSLVLSLESFGFPLNLGRVDISSLTASADLPAPCAAVFLDHSFGPALDWQGPCGANEDPSEVTKLPTVRHLVCAAVNNSESVAAEQGLKVVQEDGVGVGTLGGGVDEKIMAATSTATMAPATTLAMTELALWSKSCGLVLAVRDTLKSEQAETPPPTQVVAKAHTRNARVANLKRTRGQIER
jgi:hypothetical protein